jgi:hypothetical protein
VPIDHGKAPARQQDRVHGASQSCLVGNAVKRIGQENEIDRVRHQPGQIAGVPRDELAIGDAAFGQAAAGRIQHTAVDVDGDDAAGPPGDRQGEPAVAGAEVDHAAAGRDADGREHPCRIRPQGLPPAAGRHFGAFEKSGKWCHRTPRP